jgi:hypothetical protein
MKTKQKRWDRETKEYTENTKVDSFLSDILRVIYKHKLTISHEDIHGGFIVVPANKSKIQWLMDASIELKDSTNFKTPNKNAPTDKSTTRVKYKFYKPDEQNNQ